VAVSGMRERLQEARVTAPDSADKADPCHRDEASMPSEAMEMRYAMSRKR